MTISTQRLRFLRGNTAASSAFTGLQGELVIDTDLNTIRVQNGSTPGGTLLATAAQLANVVAGEYGNSNVTTYLSTFSGNIGNLIIDSNSVTPDVQIRTGNGGSLYVRSNSVVELQSINGASEGYVGTDNGDSYIIGSDGTSRSSIDLQAGNITLQNFNGTYYSTWVLDNEGFTTFPAGPTLATDESAFTLLASRNGHDGIETVANTVTNIKNQANVYIVANTATGAERSWKFDKYGTLTLPTGAQIGEVQLPGGLDFYAPNTASYAQVNYNNNSYIYVQQDYAQLQTPNVYLTADSGNHRAGIQAINSDNSEDSTWLFYSNGTLGAPGSIVAEFATSPAPVISGFTISSAIINATTVTASGNVTANKFIGNGALLTGLPATYSNTNVAAYMPVYGGNLLANIATATSFKTTSTGSTGGSYVTDSSGSLALYPNSSVSNSGVIIGGNGYLLAPNSSRNAVLNYNGGSGTMGIYQINVYGGQANAIVNGGTANVGNIGSSATWFGNVFANSITTGNATANYFIGNGALLTGIAASSSYGNTNVSAFLASFGSNAISTTGNITAGNLIGIHVGNASGTTATYTGNVTGSYFIGNGALLTGIAASSTYGDTNVAAYLSGNVSIGNLTANTNVTVTSNLIVGSGSGGFLFRPLVGGTGATIYGLSAAPSQTNYALSYNGASLNLNAPTGGGIYSSIQNSIVTTLTSTGLVVTGTLSTTGNTTAANLTANGNVSATYFLGNGALLTGITASANYGNSNVSGFLASFGSNAISTTGNITAGNIIANQFGNSTGTTATYTGNVTGSYFLGNGSALTGITNYSNTNVASYLTGNVTVGNISGSQPNVTLVANTTSYIFDNVGNITIPGNINYANGINILSGISGNYGNTQVAAYLPTYTGNIAGNIVKSGYTWSFGTDGQLTLPQSTQGGIPGGWLTSTSNVGLNAGGNLWRFGVDGTMTSPYSVKITTTGIQYSDGTSQNSAYGNTQVATYLPTYTGNIGATGANVTATQYGNSFGTTATYSSNVTVNALTVNNSVTIGTTLGVTGNVTAGNLIGVHVGNASGTTATYTGNVTGNYFIGNGSQLTGISQVGNIYGTSSNVTLVAGASQWTFDNTGNLTLPANTFAVYYANGTVVSLGGASSTYSNTNVASYLPTYTGNIGTTGANVIATQYGNSFGTTATYSSNVTVNALSVNNSVTIGTTLGVTGNITAANIIATQYGNSFGTTATYSSNATINALSVNNSVTIGTTLGVTGNITAANIIATQYGNSIGTTATYSGNVTGSYFLGNGALLTGITATANYSDSNVVSLLGSYGSNTIVTTGNITGGYFIGNGALLTGIVASGSTYTNANVVSMLAANTSIALGNVVTNYPTASNVTTVFIGNNTTITAGGSSNGSSYMMNNLYFMANGQLMARNTYASGAGQFYIDGATFGWSAVGSATANTAAGLGARMTLNSTALATQNSIGITSAGTLTVQGASGLVTTQTTGALFNTTATTINLGGAATTIAMGAATTVVTVGSNTGNLVVGNITTNTNITVNSTITTGTLALAAAGTGNITGVGNLVGITSNTTITAGSYVTTFDTAGNVSTTGNANISGTVYSLGTTNATAFAVVGSGAVSNVALGFFPPVGTAASMAIRDYSTANSIMYFDTTIGSGNIGGSFQFRGSNVFTQYAQIDRFGVSQPTRPAFRVYGNSSTVFTAGTTITNQAIDYNQGSYYVNSTGIFTAPVAGIYTATATLRVATNNGLNQASIQKNSSTSGANVVAFWETDTNVGTATHFPMSGTTRLAVGDTLRLQVITGNVNFDSNDSWSVTFLG